MEIEIQPEHLIPLVHNRVLLWDKTSDDYKNKQLKIAAWREICSLLIPDFDKLDEKERQQCSKLVSTKWTNLRDAWVRANKNYKKQPAPGEKSSKPYIYREQMRFLLKVSESNRTHEDRLTPKKRLLSSPTEESSPSSANSMPITVKKLKTRNLDDKMCQVLDNRIGETVQCDHPMLSFFKGVLPAVMSFNEDETLELQSGVLALIQTIKRKRENRLYSWCMQSYHNDMHAPCGPEHSSHSHQTVVSTSPAYSSLSQQSCSTHDSDLKVEQF